MNVLTIREHIFNEKNEFLQLFTVFFTTFDFVKYKKTLKPFI